MAAFCGKLLLFMAICLAEKALAQDNFGIIEPFPENIYPIEGTSAKVTCVAFDSSGVKTPARIQFMRKDQYARYTNITATDNIEFKDRIEEVEDQEGKKLKKLFVTMHIKNVTQDDDSQYGPLGRYECHAFAVGDPTERKHGFSVNVIREDEIPTVSVLKVGVLPHGTNITISCNLTEDKDSTSGLRRISWYKDNKLVQSVRNPDPKKPQDSLGPLTITNIGVRDGGNYTCKLEVLLRKVKEHNVSDSTFIRIAAWLDKPKEDAELKKFKGDSVSFECAAQGFPLEVKFKVQKKGEDTIKTCISTMEKNTNESEVHKKYDVHRSGIYNPYVLTVSDLDYTDRGFYYCCLPSNCSDNVEDNCQRFILRVRDPLGPLWPVIGILIEAIVLFLIIFIAEKRKKSKERADKQDGRVEFSFSSTDDGDRGQVRLRKVGETAVA